MSADVSGEIPARLVTADGYYDVAFDARPVFEAFADDEALANTMADLDRHGWSGGPGAARLARYLYGRSGQDALTAALDYADRAAVIGRDQSGFTVLVAEGAALQWLRRSAKDAWALFVGMRPDNRVVRAIGDTP